MAQSLSPRSPALPGCSPPPTNKEPLPSPLISNSSHPTWRGCAVPRAQHRAAPHHLQRLAKGHMPLHCERDRGWGTRACGRLTAADALRRALFDPSLQLEVQEWWVEGRVVYPLLAAMLGPSLGYTQVWARCHMPRLDQQHGKLPLPDQQHDTPPLVDQQRVQGRREAYQQLRLRGGKQEVTATAPGTPQQHEGPRPQVQSGC